MVAGILAAMAPESMIMPLRVFDDNGSADIFNLAKSIRYAVQNGAQVINMSFGAAPKDTYTTDPLCLAARRAYNAGMVVVAAAGNNGKDAQGHKIYGGINSPGSFQLTSLNWYNRMTPSERHPVMFMPGKAELLPSARDGGGGMIAAPTGKKTAPSARTP